MGTLDEYLKNYDLHKIKQLSNNPGHLTIKEKFFSILAFVELGELSEALRFVESWENELRKFELYYFLKLECAQLSNKEQDSYFYNVFNESFSTINDEVMKARLYFGLGFFFLTKQEHLIAIPFYQNSLGIFQEKKLHALSWRVEYNLLLCRTLSLSRGELTQQILELYESFDELPKNAQIFFSKFLVWTLLFVGELKLAERLLDRTLKYDRASLENSYLSDLYSTALYMNLDSPDMSNTKTLTTEIYRGIKPVLVASYQAIASLQKTNSKEIIDFINSSLEKFDFEDSFMLIAYLFRSLFRNAYYQKLLDIFKGQELTLTRIMKSSVIPPEDLFHYPILSALKLNKPNLAKEIEKSRVIFKSSIHDKYLQSQKTLILNERQKNQVQILISTNQIVIDGIKFDFKRRIKSFLLISTIAKTSKNGINLERLNSLLFGKKVDANEKERIRILIHRTNKYFDFCTPLIYEKRGTIFKNEKFAWKLENQNTSIKQLRRKQLMELLKKNRTQFTARELSIALGVTSRTILSDLNWLKEKKRVKCNGIGRSTTYFYSD